MEANKQSPKGIWLSHVNERTKEYRLPFLSAIVFGLLAHMFAFANKLVNADEIESLFGKGATLTSGRWGLEAVKIIFPDYSMPWLWGIISLMLLAVSVCLIVKMFEIKGHLTQLLLAGMIAAFPSQTGNFCFMFTSSAYALAFLFSVLTAYLIFKGGKLNAALGVILLVLSLGLYQAYIALSASLLLLCMVKQCLDGEKCGVKALLFGVRALLLMLAALAIYVAVTLLVFKLTGTEFNDYVRENTGKSGILGRVRMAYDFFVYYFSYREYALITSEASRWGHIVLAALCAVGIAIPAVKKLRAHDILTGLVLAGCALLLPLAINCMFLAMDKYSIHTLVIYSFVAIYVLAAILLERVFTGGAPVKRASRDVIYLCLALALVSNIYFANEVYLKMYLSYENAYSFYSILISRAENLPDFSTDKKLAIIGVQDNAVTQFDEIDVGYITGPSKDLINIYSRENFIRRYLGSDILLADSEEIEELEQTDEFAEMAEYPYYGSIKIIGDYIVVKLG